MRIPRFYTSQALQTDLALTLEASTAHHVARVLRMQVGDPLVVFNGTGGEYHSHIEHMHKALVQVRVGRHHVVERESALKITLAQAISKGDRMDFCLQKATELGVDAVQPLETERSVQLPMGDRRKKRLQHWHGVIRSACEQSGRSQLPRLEEIQPLSSWLLPTDSNVPLLVLDPNAEQSLQQIFASAPSAVTLLIGPEGGLSAAEFATLYARGSIGIRMGPRILRTETAALAAVAALQTLWGDF